LFDNAKDYILQYPKNGEAEEAEEELLAAKKKAATAEAKKKKNWLKTQDPDAASLSSAKSNERIIYIMHKLIRDTFRPKQQQFGNCATADTQRGGGGEGEEQQEEDQGTEGVEKSGRG
jgi:hypothetical protein